MPLLKPVISASLKKVLDANVGNELITNADVADALAAEIITAIKSLTITIVIPPGLVAVAGTPVAQANPAPIAIPPTAITLL